MYVESPPDDVLVTGFPVGHLGIEIDVRVDLQTLEVRTIPDGSLTAPFPILFPVLVGLGYAREVEVVVVALAVSHGAPSRCC